MARKAKKNEKPEAELLLKERMAAGKLNMYQEEMPLRVS